MDTDDQGLRNLTAKQHIPLATLPRQSATNNSTSSLGHAESAIDAARRSVSSRAEEPVAAPADPSPSKPRRQGILSSSASSGIIGGAGDLIDLDPNENEREELTAGEQGLALPGESSSVASEQQSSGQRNQPDASALNVQVSTTLDTIAPNPPTQPELTGIESHQQPSRDEIPEPQPPEVYRYYTDYLSSLYQNKGKFPGLGTILEHSRSDHIDVTFIDCSAGKEPHVQVMEIEDLGTPDETNKAYERLTCVAEQRVLGDIRLRLVLVQDLSNRLATELGRCYDLDPEFFADHLQGSDHIRKGASRFHTRSIPKIENGYALKALERRYFIHPDRKELTYRKLPLSSSHLEINTMHKSYRSFWWYRPVELRPLKSFKPKAKEEAYNMRTSISNDDLSPDPNKSAQFSAICRLQHWEFEADESMTPFTEYRKARPMAFWKERISVCELDINGCPTGRLEISFQRLVKAD